MRYALLIGAWELIVRPLANRGLTIALRAVWAWEQRRLLATTAPR